MDSYFYVECPKNGMLITALVHARGATKAYGARIYLVRQRLKVAYYKQ